MLLGLLLRMQEARIAVRELAALAAVAAAPGCSLREVAARLRLAKASASRSVRVLVGGGLVAQQDHPTNGRLVVLSVTEKGAALLAALRGYCL